MRSEKHLKRKKGRWVTVLLVFLVLFGSAAAYSYYQYKQGVSQSLKKAKIENHNKQVYTFEGKKDLNGGTNVLLLGSDARGQEYSRSDTIMILHYREDMKTFKVTSIMRDSYVNIPGYGKRKINAAFAEGGPELMRQTIKDNFGIDLQYYAIVDFQGFVQLINEVFPNGVETNVEKSMSKYIGVSLNPGLQRLDGEHLLGYVRFRHDAIGDFGRVKRQQQVVQAIGNQLSTFETITKLPKLMGVVSPFVTTNLDAADALFIAKDFVSKKQPVQTLRIPVDNSFTESTIPKEGAILDIDVEKNREALNQFISQ